MEISVQRHTAMKVAALYNPLEKFLDKYRKNDFDATEQDLTAFYNERRIEAGKEPAQSIEPIEVEKKPIISIKEEKEEIVGALESESITVEILVKKKSSQDTVDKKAIEVAAPIEAIVAAPTKAKKVKAVVAVKEKKERVGKVEDIPLTEKIMKIINSKIIIKSQKVRLLYKEGMSLGQISREMKVYYSFAKIAIFREFKRDMKLLPEIY